MSNQPPPFPLGYANPGHQPRPPRRSTAKPLLLGLLAGSLVSAAVWPWAFKYPQPANGVIIFLIPAKIILGIVCLCLRGKRAFGGGLLLSVAVGFLIFFGACAANFKI